MPTAMLLTRIAFCAAAGVGCGMVARIWIRRLLQQRGLADCMTSRTEWLLNSAMAIPGGAVGAMTTGVISAACGLLLLGICMTVSVIDWSYRIIPNQAVLAVFGIRLLMGISNLAGNFSQLGMEIVQSLIGLAACFAIFALPGLMGKRIGAGDIKLAAAMGFLLGIHNALLGVIIMGLMILGYSMMQKQMPILMFLNTNIPMGPFITAGMFLSFLNAMYLL